MTVGKKGDHYRYLLKHRRPKSIPQAFFVPAKPAPEYLFWWDAFWELSSERAMNMGVGPIPWRALREFGTDRGLGQEQFDMLRRIVRSLDRVFMRYANSSPEED